MKLTLRYLNLPELQAYPKARRVEIYRTFLQQHGYHRNIIIPILCLWAPVGVFSFFDDLFTLHGVLSEFAYVAVIVSSGILGIILMIHVYLQSLRPHLRKFVQKIELQT